MPHRIGQRRCLLFDGDATTAAIDENMRGNARGNHDRNGMGHRLDHRQAEILVDRWVNEHARGGEHRSFERVLHEAGEHGPVSQPAPANRALHGLKVSGIIPRNQERQISATSPQRGNRLYDQRETLDRMDAPHAKDNLPPFQKWKLAEQICGQIVLADDWWNVHTVGNNPNSPAPTEIRQVIGFTLSRNMKPGGQPDVSLEDPRSVKCF